MSDLPEIVEATVIRPGDKLIVRVPMGTRLEHCQQLKAAIEGWLPDVRAYVVTAEQILVQRGEEGGSDE